MAAYCAVCHEPLNNGGKSCSTKSGDKSCAAKCGHVLHNSCWENWLERRSECPECRMRISKEDLIVLFFNEDDSVNHDINTLSYDIQNLNITTKPKSVKSEKPEVIDLGDSEDQDLFYSGSESEVEREVVVIDESDALEEDEESEELSYLRSEDGSISESELSSFLSDGTESEATSDDTGSEDSLSDQSGSEGSSVDETGSEGSAEDVVSCDEIVCAVREKESGSYETESVLDIGSSASFVDETGDSDN